MSFEHGITISERASDLEYAISTELGAIVAVGVAPSYLAEDPKEFSISYNLQEAENQLGYSSDWDSFTLCEAVYSTFFQYAVAPLVCINVLDPTRHNSPKTETKTGVNISTTIGLAKDVILSSVRILSTNTDEEDIELVLGTDFEINDDREIEFLSVTKITDGTIKLNYNYIDPSRVTSSDIVNGIAKISEIYPRFSIIPSIIICPKWSTQSEVIAAMKVQAHAGIFDAMAIVDIPSTTPYDQVAALKQTLNINDSHLIACYPKISLGGVQYHLSTQLAGLMMQVAIRNDQVPYESPSNKNLQMDSACDSLGNSIYYTQEKANYLNGVGIVTALNFAGGWKAWGNRTSVFPNNSDVKDNFIPVRMMFNFVGNNLVVNYWSKIDSAMTRRFIDSAVNAARIWLAGLVASGALIDADVDFVESDNTVTDLANGQLKFRLSLTPPSAAEHITFTLQYDAEALRALFSSNE